MPDEIFRATMNVSATPEQVSEWILDPAKVLLYAPGPLSGGVFTLGQCAWIRLKSGVSLLERVSSSASRELVTVRVTSSTLKREPETKDAILGAKLITFYEDWHLERSGPGTRITKVWRDLEKHKMRLLPFALFIRQSAKKDRSALEAAWGGKG